MGAFFKKFLAFWFSGVSGILNNGQYYKRKFIHLSSGRSSGSLSNSPGGAWYIKSTLFADALLSDLSKSLSDSGFGKHNLNKCIPNCFSWFLALRMRSRMLLLSSCFC